MKIFRWSAICGILSPVIYVLAVFLGNFLHPDYNQIRQTVSYLTAFGAHNQSLFVTLFLISNLLMMIFAVGFFIAYKNLLLKTGSAVLVLIGILNIILLLFYPIFESSYVIQPIEIVHNNIVYIIALLTVFAVLLCYLGFLKEEYFKIYAKYTFVVFVALVVVWIAAYFAVNARADFRGIIQKAAIILFLQWIFVIGLRFYKSITSRLDLL